MADRYTWLTFSADYRNKHQKATIQEVSAAWKKYKKDNNIETAKDIRLETVVEDVDEKKLKPITKKRAKPAGKLITKFNAVSPSSSKKTSVAKRVRGPTPVPRKSPVSRSGQVVAVRTIGNRKTISYNCDEFPSAEEATAAAIKVIDVEFSESNRKTNITALWLHKRYDIKPDDKDLIDSDFNDFLRNQGEKGVGKNGTLYIDIQLTITRSRDGYEFTSVTYNFAQGKYQVPHTAEYTVFHRTDGLYTEPELYEELLPYFQDFLLIDINILIEALEARENCPKSLIIKNVGDYILNTYYSYVNYTGGDKYPWLRTYFANPSKNAPWVDQVRKYWEGDLEETLGLYLSYRSILYVDNALRGKYEIVEYPTYREFYPERVNYVHELNRISILGDLPGYIKSYDAAKAKITGTTPRNEKGKPVYRPIVPPKPLPPIPKKAAAITTRSPPKFKPEAPATFKPKPPTPVTIEPVVVKPAPTPKAKSPPKQNKPLPAKPSPRKSPGKNVSRRPELVDCNREMTTEDFINGVKNRLDRLLESGITSEVEFGEDKRIVSKVYVFSRSRDFPIKEEDDEFSNEIRKRIPKANRGDDKLFSLDTYAVFMKQKRKEGDDEDNYFVRRYYLFVTKDNVIPSQKAIPYAYDVELEKESTDTPEYAEEGITEILNNLFEEVEFVDFWSYHNAWEYFWTGKCPESAFGKEVGMVKKFILDALPDRTWVDMLINDKNTYKDNLPSEDETNQGELGRDYHILLYLLGAAQGDPQKYRFGVSRDPIVKSSEEFYKKPIDNLEVIRTKFRELFSRASRKTGNKPSALATALSRPGPGFLQRKVVG